MHIYLETYNDALELWEVLIDAGVAHTRAFMASSELHELYPIYVMEPTGLTEEDKDRYLMEVVDGDS